jgi:hypothetical protein
MKMKVKKLDRRFTGHNQWNYYVDFKQTMVTEDAREWFFAVRVWCWEQWGPSREANSFYSSRLELFPSDHPEVLDKNENWSWIMDEYKYRIYLKGNNEASLFTLKWA